MPGTEAALTALTVAAALSLGVERTLELLKHFMDFGNGSLNPRERGALEERATELIDRAEQTLAGKLPPAAPPAVAVPRPKDDASASHAAGDAEPAEKYPTPRIPVVPMDPLSPQDTANALFFQFAAAGLGILLAYFFDMRLLSALGAKGPPAAGWSQVFGVADTLFTGLVIGGGSQPIHVLIRFISERKLAAADAQALEDAEKEVEKTRALGRVVSTSRLIEETKEAQPLQWVDFVYDGGLAPERLQAQHLRSGPPNLVVYHHTAMSSVSSFEDVVKEFVQRKKWLTGYHVVVMPDGAIKPFCRWDRYGSHAAGLNDRSLGIAFHGNFHTLPGDQFSNADGRYGNQTPTEAQLHAGARVVALWTYLYEDIKLDFGTSILAHRKAMPGHTVCPGSNFPYDGFERLLRDYRDAWSHSDPAQAGIARFSQLQYVYA